MSRCDQQRRQQAEEEEEEEEESRCKWDDDCKEYIWPGLLFFAAVVSVIALIITVLTDRPDPPSPSMRVYGASASMFELDDDDGVTTLRYNLDLNVSVCNESKGFWEKTYLVYHLVATALYGGVPLGYVALVEPAEPLLLLLKSDGCSIPTAPPLRPALFRGETTLPAGSQAAALFRREEGEGMFTIDVHLHLWNMHTLPTGDPGVDGRKFYSRSLSYLGNDTSVKLRRPDQSSSSSSSSAALGRRTGGDDVVVRRLLRS